MSVVDHWVVFVFGVPTGFWPEDGVVLAGAALPLPKVEFGWPFAGVAGFWFGWKYEVAFPPPAADRVSYRVAFTASWRVSLSDVWRMVCPTSTFWATMRTDLGGS